jgi:hypothetical protein
VDRHVDRRGRRAAALDLLALRGPGASEVVAARHLWTVADVTGRVELAVTGDGRLLAALAGQELVRVYSPEGALLADLKPARPFRGLASVAVVEGGRVVALDREGLQLFRAGDLAWEGALPVRGLGSPRGLCQGEPGELVLVNKCLAGDSSEVTRPGETDLLYVSSDTGRVLRRLEMVDILGEESRDSECSHIAFQVTGDGSRVTLSPQGGRLHLVDSGLDRLYTFYTEDSEPQAMLCGDSGKWRRPAGVAADSRGALLVADAGNSRLLILDPDWRFAGRLELDRPLSRPKALCIDIGAGAVLLHDAAAKEIVKFVMADKKK